MKPYGIAKKFNAWDDYTRQARALSDAPANRDKATKRRVKKTLKTRGRRWEIENN